MNAKPNKIKMTTPGLNRFKNLKNSIHALAMIIPE
jgi:hypothetical protein